MNILDYSILLGRALNKSNAGKKIKEVYHELSNKYNDEKSATKKMYQNYNHCVENECSRNHFYGWNIAYEKFLNYLEKNIQNKDNSFVDTAKLLKENEEFKNMADISKQMGAIVELIFDSVLRAKYDEECILELFKVFKVKNAIKDLQIAIERSGIKMYMINNASLLADSDSTQYERIARENNYIPYMGRRKPEMFASGLNSFTIDLIDRILFIKYMVLLGVFNGFWNITIELSVEDILEEKINSNDVISKGFISHKRIENELINPEAWLYKIIDNADFYYFLANERNLNFGENQGKCDVSGLIYPKEDIGLYEKEVLTEIKIQ